jgi:ubiquitin carboxyl-terminal hydrolase 7
LNINFRFKFHDNFVTPVTDSEVLENNYGGDDHRLAQFTNAYTLVYFRESNINEILTPMVSEDMPNYLRMYANMFKLIKGDLNLIISL